MNIRQNVRNSRGIIKVLHTAFAVAVVRDIHQMHGSPCRSIVYTATRQLQIMGRIARPQRDRAVGAGQRVFYQRTRETDASVVSFNRTRAGQIGHATGRRIGQPDGFQRLKGCLVDGFHIRIAQRFVCPALHAGADGPHMLGKGFRAGSTAGRTAATAQGCLVCHVFGPKVGKGKGGLTPTTVPLAQPCHAPHLWSGKLL